MKRRLTAIAIISLATFFSIFDTGQIEEYSRILRVFDTERDLSKNLGNGNCEWTAPVNEEITDRNTTTLLVAYPGSGKRLCWRIFEALTGYVTGDDWDLSLEGHGTLFVKTSYPHHEGIWGWGDTMDQAILLLRNPRWSIPSYHTIRYEIDFSTDWEESYAHINSTYTERSPNELWAAWRNSRFDTEIDLWGWHIDFWMQGGLRRDDGTGHSFVDPHCGVDMNDCRPKEIIQYEKMVDPNEAVRIEELDRISKVLDDSPNVNIIASEARPCVYKKVWERDEFYNPNRDGNGPPPVEKTFTRQQVNIMRREVCEMRDKYSIPPLNEKPHAGRLVYILDQYCVELTDEYKNYVDIDDGNGSNDSNGSDSNDSNGSDSNDSNGSDSGNTSPYIPPP